MPDGSCFHTRSEKHMIITVTFTSNTYTLYVFKDDFCTIFTSALTTKTEFLARCYLARAHVCLLRFDNILGTVRTTVKEELQVSAFQNTCFLFRIHYCAPRDTEPRVALQHSYMRRYKL